MILLPQIICAQKNDFQAWYSLDAGFKIGKKWSFGLSDEIRTSCNAQVFSKNLFDLGGEYKLTENIDLGLFVRVSTEYPTLESRTHQKTFYTTFQYSRKFDRLNISGRFRIGTDEDFDMPVQTEWEHREKLKAAYNIKKFPLNPELSAELFFPAGNDFLGLTKTRILAGFSWRPKSDKNHKFTVQYGWQHKYNSDVPKNDFLLCLGYGYTFKIKEKKK